MSKEPNVFTGRPFSLLVRPSDITAPPVHNMNRFNPYTSAEKVDLGQELMKLREESVNLPPLPIDSEQLRVYVRLRPTDLPDEQVDKTYRIDAGQRLYVSVTNAGATAEHELRFSHIFSCKATQQEVFFGAARPLVFNFIGGDNALIFAYGCTSSGKTFTIEGTPDNPGVLPRCVQTIFCQLNVVEQHRLQPVRFNEFNVLSSRQAEAAAAEKAALFTKIHAEVKNVHFDQDASTSCFFPDVLQQAGRQCSLFMGFVEIYNNNVYDLLGPSMQSSENQPFAQKNTKQPKQPKLIGKTKQPLEPREALQVGEDILHNTYVKELQWIQVNTAQEALELVAFAQRNMTFASTFFNMNSSRSHVICFIRLAYWTVKDCDESTVMETTCGVSSIEEHGSYQTLEVDKSSVMAICDLAGSERQPTIGHQVDRLREAGNINTDLLTLGQCLTGMHNNQLASRKLQAKQNPAAGAAAVVAKKKPTEEPVPYRSCRLTYLLKAFLVGGRARVAMISAIVPTVELLEQNMQVLRYAAFASEVVVYRKLEPAVIEKFQKAKQKQQSLAVAKAARRLSQAPRGRAAMVASASKKGAVSEGTPITEVLVKIQEEMGDALDAQLVVMDGINDNYDEDGSEEEGSGSDDSEGGEEEEEESCESDDDEAGGEGAHLSKAELIRLLRGVCGECKQLHEENANLKTVKEAAELEAKRQRGYYEMMKEKFKEAMEEIDEIKASRPSVNQCVDTDGLPPVPSRSDSLLRTHNKPDRPAFLKAEKSGLIAALGLAEPSLRWQISQKTTMWTDEESASKLPSQEKVADKRKISEEDEDDCRKRSRLETPLAAPAIVTATLPIVCEQRKDRNAGSPSPMPINKFSTHTKASILRMRMHQANVIKERHNAVQMKTPILHPTNPDDLSLDEAMPNMPAELQRRLEHIQMLKHSLAEVEQQRDDLQRQLDELPSLEKIRHQDEALLKLKADLEFEKQLCQQNASEAETLRCENVELKTAFEAVKKTEQSLHAEVARHNEEIARLKERISELQNDLQTVYEELNSSRLGKENESQMFNEQIESVRNALAKTEQELKEARSDYANKIQELETVKLQLITTQQKMAEIEKERQELLEEAHSRQDRGNTTGRLEELQFDVDEAHVELETLRSKVRTLEESVQSQTGRIQELEADVQRKSSEIANLEARCYELQETINKNTECFNKEREDLVRQREEAVRNLDERLRSTQEELQVKSNEVDSLRKEISSLESTLNGLAESKQSDEQSGAAKLKEVELAYEKALSDLSEKSSEVSALFAKISELERLGDKLKETESAYETAISNLSAKTAEALNLQTKLGELERMAERLKEVEPAYEKALSDLSEKSSEVSSLYAKISDLDNTTKEHSERFASLTAEMEKLNTEKESLVSKLQQERAEFEEAKRVEVASLSAKIAELEAEIRSKTADYDHLSNRFASVEAELIDARQEIDRCRAEFDAERSILTKTCEDDAKTLLDAKMLVISKLELRLDDSEKTISNQRLQIVELTERHASKVAELEGDLAKQRAENAILVGNEAELLAQCASFKVQVTAVIEQTVRTHRQSIDTLSQKLVMMTERLSKYQTLIRQLKTVLNEKNDEQTAILEDRIKSLTEHRDAMEEALNGRIRGLEAEGRDKDNEISVLRKDRDAARDKEERSLRLADEKEQEAVELREQVETLNGRLLTASNKLQEMQDGLGQKNTEYQKLVDELEAEKSMCAQLKVKLQDVERSLEIQRQEDKKETAAFSKVVRELSEKKDVVAQKNARIAELEQEVQRLSGNVERLESVLSTKEAQIAKMVVASTDHQDEVDSTPAATVSLPITTRAGRGGGRRTGKRKQGMPMEHEAEPSDSEMDALVTAQMQVVGSENVAVAAEEPAVDASNKRRRRGRGAVSAAEQQANNSMVKTQSDVNPQQEQPQDEQLMTTRSGAKVAPVTRARARGRQRNTQQSEQVEELEENERCESAEGHSTRHNTRKRGADQQKNVQSHLLPNFDGNDGGSYV